MSQYMIYKLSLYLGFEILTAVVMELLDSGIQSRAVR
jgi:hypothetical protein